MLIARFCPIASECYYNRIVGKTTRLIAPRIRTDKRPPRDKFPPRDRKRLAVAYAKDDCASDAVARDCVGCE